MSEAADFLSPVAGGRVSDQIVTQITALINGGTLSPGDRLPPERVLVCTGADYAHVVAEELLRRNHALVKYDPPEHLVRDVPQETTRPRSMTQAGRARTDRSSIGLAS